MHRGVALLTTKRTAPICKGNPLQGPADMHNDLAYVKVHCWSTALRQG
jgi:hypothetical protein